MQCITCGSEACINLQRGVERIASTKSGFKPNCIFCTKTFSKDWKNK